MGLTEGSHSQELRTNTPETVRRQGVAPFLMSSGKTSTPKTSIPSFERARARQPSPQPTSKTRCGVRSDTALTNGWSVSNLRPQPLRFGQLSPKGQRLCAKRRLFPCRSIPTWVHMLRFGHRNLNPGSTIKEDRTAGLLASTCILQLFDPNVNAQLSGP